MVNKAAVCVIPARGGSRRIPNKNRRLFHGRPIIAYSIKTARASGLFDRIIVSTDDPEIAWVAACNCDLVQWRDPDDGVRGTQEVTANVLRTVVADYVCCLYATAPTMTVADLQRGYDALLSTDRYAYIHGWYYWGRADWFGDKELSEGAELERPKHWIDINTPEDWAMAERMYAELQEG